MADDSKKDAEPAAEPTRVPFVHLHVHTTYSMLDGACQIPALVKRVKALGMSACAITDHGNLFGLKHFYDICRKQGVKPILGCEAYVARRTRHDRVKDEGDLSGNHLILLAKNLVGYRNLLRLGSLAHIEGFYGRPRIDRELLEKYHEGLICSSACIAGEVPEKFLQGDAAGAEKAARWFQKLFGDDYYLEIMLHKPTQRFPRRPGEEPVEELQARANAAVLELGKKLGIKVIATNDVHFLLKDDAEAHDALLCVGAGNKVADENRLRYTRQEWLKSYDEMVANLPGNVEQIHNTTEIADKIEEYKLDSDPILPVFPIPESFGREEEWREKFGEKELKEAFGERYDKLRENGSDLVRIKFESDYLEHLTWEGAAKRWPEGVPPEVKERLAFELETIRKMGFPGYFLIVSDYIAAARSMGVLVGPGRGSAAGSAVAYCLKITNLDPVRYDLLFERFLNPDRISMPDIDVDFDDDGRQKVLEWVTQKYGVDHVAHIVTFGQMAPKMAIKDVARVMDMPIPDSNRLAKMVPEKPKITFEEAIKESSELRVEMESRDPAVRKVLGLARRLDGTLRQPGVHACGVIIARNPLIETIPVMPTKGESLLTTQYDGHFVEPIGLLKMDFLGLKTLTVIKECAANVKRAHGIDLDMDAIPIDDPKAYELFSRGDTTGVFQFESEGMKKYLMELQPTCLEDLVAMNALYRPGPMQYIPEFIDRKHGRKPTTYDHPLMEKYLKNTYGICVYQEQVMLLSRLLGGFTGGQSDTLRKAMGKKKIEEMEKLKVKFEAGCLANPDFRVGACKDEAAAKKLIGKIWDDWTAFASYAFNKSHAVCYAYVAYQTGYLKAHYPAEYMCAQISSEIGKYDKLPALVSDASDMGLKVLPPDVNESFSRFFPSSADTIRYGLAGIKGVGTLAADDIIAEREANGPYKTVVDFVERMIPHALTKRVYEALAKSGAFDSFGMHRAQIFANMDLVFARVSQRLKEKASGQGNLFECLGVDDGSSKIDLPEAPAWSDKERLEYERELLGVYLSGHPLDRYREIIRTFRTFPLVAADEVKVGTKKEVRVAGIVERATERIRRAVDPSTGEEKDQKWAILTLDDAESTIDVLVFSDCYAKYSPACVADNPVMVCGTLGRREDDSRGKIIASEIYPLAEVPKVFTDGVLIAVGESELERVIEPIKKIAAAHPGRARLLLAVFYNDGRRTVLKTHEEFSVEPSEEFRAACQEAVGEDRVRLLPKKEICASSGKRHWGGRG